MKSTLCIMRDICKAMSEFKAEFEQLHGLSLNEAMVLCSLREAGDEGITSTAIAGCTDMKASHASKVIRSVEDKKLIECLMGKVDKRNMYFRLTDAGKERLIELDKVNCDIPALLRPVFQAAK